MRLFPVLFGALLVPVAARAQATIKTSAQLRSNPDGVLLATVRSGATVERGPARGAWTRVTLEGYVYKTGIGGKSDTFDISAASDGVLLRATAGPTGTQLARLQEGMGLVRVGRRGEWLKVRRTAWVRSSALAEPARSATAARGNTVARAESPSVGEPAATSLGEVAEPADSSTLGAGGGAATAMLVAGRRTELRRAPDGGALAILDSNTQLTTLAHERGWVRVRVEGWVRDADVAPMAGSALTELSAADLRAEPDRYRGQTVRWKVQKIALQTADPLRHDFAPEEPYLLARGPGAEHSLLYLAVPRSLLEQARRVKPLAMVTVTARVRVGRSEPSGVPLLDVLSIAEQ